MAKTVISESMIRIIERKCIVMFLSKSLVLLLFSAFITLFALSDKVYSDMGRTRAADANIGEEKRVAFEEYVSEGSFFKVALPSGWSKVIWGFGLSAEEKKVYGVNVLGPTSKDEIASLISVHYYAPGNLLHETMEGFINIHSKPVLGVNLGGREYGPVRVEMVAGRSAKVFERKVYEYIEPRVLNPKKIPVYERYVVIPANKGFYVLWYSAPEDIAEEYQGVFEKVISSFEPLLK